MNGMGWIPWRRNAEPGGVRALLSSFGLEIPGEESVCLEVTSPFLIPLGKAVSRSSWLLGEGQRGFRVLWEGVDPAQVCGNTGIWLGNIRELWFQLHLTFPTFTLPLSPHRALRVSQAPQDSRGTQGLR